MSNENLGKKNAPEECVSDRAGIPEGDLGESSVRESANAMRKRAKEIYNKAKCYDAFYNACAEMYKEKGNVSVHLGAILFMLQSGIEICNYME